MCMKYYILKNKKMPWGDYGRILFTGLLTVLDDNFNDLDIPEIERTGAYVPEIYIANTRNIVLVDTIKKNIEESDITGIVRFKKVLKKKIVNINWESWDLNDKSPLFYPKSKEPEDYILKGKNDEQLSLSMPNMWELDVVRKHKLKRISDKPDNVNFSDLVLTETPKLDIFLAENMLFIIVSEKFKELIISNKLDTLEFTELKTE